MDPRRLLPYLLALTVCAVLATGDLVLLTQHPAAPPQPVSAAAPATPRDVLAAWDSRRAEAWATGDVEALRELYVAGSPTGRADVRMLSAYVARGLHVEGLTTQVLAWRVVDEAPDALTIRVTDRVVGGAVVGEGTSTLLPRDRASTRTMVLRRVDGDWRMWAVRERT
ncbi:MAG: hypothetical protein JWN68_3831 [Nocardioides sp.]|jgi:hypothetical protein|uniref:hypothetical protein n=1 Tax=Nocardioides sp. TaxID=35761 RepID=UPI0026254B9C|nr:hypothetical protein [Nocardioides sp.]MCW2835878.1 hypothetical protein [Nocardioides sp.]